MSRIRIWLFKKLCVAKNHLKKRFSENIEVPQQLLTMPKNFWEATFSLVESEMSDLRNFGWQQICLRSPSLGPKC